MTVKTLRVKTCLKNNVSGISSTPRTYTFPRVGKQCEADAVKSFVEERVPRHIIASYPLKMQELFNDGRGSIEVLSYELV